MQTENANLKEARHRYYLKHKDKILSNSKEWRKKNPDKVKGIWRRSNLKRKYGLSEKSFENLFEEQGNSCAICHTKEAIWCVDHCHTTGEIRGILCASCNKGLGMFKDDQTNLEEAISYLNRIRQPKRS